MTLFAWRMIPMDFYSASSRKPMKPQPTWEGGTERRWSGLMTMFRSIEAPPGVLDRRPVPARPQAKTADRFKQGAAQPGELIIHARGNCRKNSAGNQTVALQAAQRQGQHALRNAAERAANLIEPFPTTPQFAYYQHRPFVTHTREHLAHRPTVLGHVQGTWYHLCAFLKSSLGHLY